jgi:hypothetical protein
MGDVTARRRPRGHADGRRQGKLHAGDALSVKALHEGAAATTEPRSLD